jgi:hypothetical protein
MATKTITIRSYDEDGAPVAEAPTWVHYVVPGAAPQPTPPAFSAVDGATGAYRVTVELAVGQTLVALAQAGAYPVEVSLAHRDLLDVPTAAEVASEVDAPSAAAIAAEVDAPTTAEIDAALSAAHGEGSWKSASVQVVTSVDGAVATTPAGLARTLSVGALVGGAIGPLSAGDSHTVARTVEGVPDGETIAKAWLTLKVDSSLPDDRAAAQLVITPTNAAGTGHVEDTGGDGTAVLRFDLPATRTTDLVPARAYDVRVLTSGGTVATLERGTLSVVLSPTRAIA